jgi:hypothetical protein
MFIVTNVQSDIRLKGVQQTGFLHPVELVYHLQEDVLESAVADRPLEGCILLLL